MDLASLTVADLAGVFLGLFFTLAIFTYILGDNALFRFTIHIFIGVAAGYAAMVAWFNVIWPQLFQPLISGTQPERLFLIVPLVLGVLLLAKSSSRLAGWGSISLAFMVGVGVASAIGGAVLGTLFPQSNATMNLFSPQALPGGTDFIVKLIEALIILLGTLTTLIYFHFGAHPKVNQPPRRSPVVEGLAWIGQIFIAIALGAIFAGVYTAALTALVERSQFVVTLILSLIKP
jgi:hypothetical protein